MPIAEQQPLAALIAQAEHAERLFHAASDRLIEFVDRPNAPPAEELRELHAQLMGLVTLQRDLITNLRGWFSDVTAQYDRMEKRDEVIRKQYFDLYSQFAERLQALEIHPSDEDLRKAISAFRLAKGMTEILEEQVGALESRIRELENEKALAPLQVTQLENWMTADRAWMTRTLAAIAFTLVAPTVTAVGLWWAGLL